MIKNLLVILLAVFLIFSCTCRKNKTEIRNILNKETNRNKILNGDLVTENDKGVVLAVVDVSEFCPIQNAHEDSIGTGVFINKRNVLTSKHLFTLKWDGLYLGHVTDPAKVKIYYNGVEYDVLEFRENPEADLATITLMENVTINGEENFSQQIYQGSDESLINENLLIMGHSPGAIGGQEIGTLRQTVLPVDHVGSGELFFRPNEQGQIVWHGDSGGPSFLISEDNKYYLTGINERLVLFDYDLDEYGIENIEFGVQVGPQAIRDWLFGKEEERATLKIDGVDNFSQGNGIACTDLNNNGQPDMLVMSCQAPFLVTENRDRKNGSPEYYINENWHNRKFNEFKYIIAKDLNQNGIPQSVSAVKTVSASDNLVVSGGCDVEICNLDIHSQPECFFVTYQKVYLNAPESLDINENTDFDQLLKEILKDKWSSYQFQFRIGYNADQNGDFRNISPIHSFDGIGNYPVDMGAAIADINRNDIPDLLLLIYNKEPHYEIDDPCWGERVRYKIGWDINEKGHPDSWSNVKTKAGFNYDGKTEVMGIGVEVEPIQSTGSSRMIITYLYRRDECFHYYAQVFPDLDSEGNAYQMNGCHFDDIVFTFPTNGIGFDLYDFISPERKEIFLSSYVTFRTLGSDPRSCFYYKIGKNMNSVGIPSEWLE